MNGKWTYTNDETWANDQANKPSFKQTSVFKCYMARCMRNKPIPEPEKNGQDCVLVGLQNKRHTCDPAQERKQQKTRPSWSIDAQCLVQLSNRLETICKVQSKLNWHNMDKQFLHLCFCIFPIHFYGYCKHISQMVSD